MNEVKKTVFIILPESMDPERQDIACEKLKAACGWGLNIVVLPLGTQVIYGDPPYVYQEKLREYEYEINFGADVELFKKWVNYTREPHIVWVSDTLETTVGYPGSPGHEHNDNCMRRWYRCEDGHKTELSIRRSCPNCEWQGKEECFCHPGKKVDQWPEVQES